MRVKAILKAIPASFERNRRIGHTLSAVKGRADNTLVVAANNRHRRVLAKSVPMRDIITLEEIASDKLRGNKRPVVFDHYAVEELCWCAQSRIEALETELKTRDERNEAG